MLRIRVPASTSNLGSGFDTLGLALQLYLNVEIEVTGGEAEIVSYGEGAAELPPNEDHLIYRSIRRVFDLAGKTIPGLKMKASNEIPLSRGLGSSGAATVAGLMAGSYLAEHDLTGREIVSMASMREGHPENAASSYLGGLTINCMSANQVVTRKVTVDEELKAVVFIPEVNISTDDAREALPDMVRHSDAVFNVQRVALLTEAFLSRDYDTLTIAMQDKLHQSYRAALIPEYERFEAAGHGLGALGVCVSGSGSSIIAFVQKDPDALMLGWLAMAEKHGVRGRCLVLSVDNRGARLENPV